VQPRLEVLLSHKLYPFPHAVVHLHGAGDGLPHLAALWARGKGLRVRVFRPDRQRHGGAAERERRQDVEAKLLGVPNDLPTHPVGLRTLDQALPRWQAATFALLLQLAGLARRMLFPHEPSTGATRG
jgi:hypothetical protein